MLLPASVKARSPDSPDFGPLTPSLCLWSYASRWASEAGYEPLSIREVAVLLGVSVALMKNI
jgi:hypothetical protein